MKLTPPEGVTEVGFTDAKKAFGGDVAESYVNHRTADVDDDDTHRDAYVTASGPAIFGFSPLSVG